MMDLRPDDHDPATVLDTHPMSSRTPGSSPFQAPDGLAFASAALITFVIYLCTLAPGVTLGFSGIFSVGAQYMGVPHPPGYPLWTAYAGLFVKFLPAGDIAWRAAVASAFAGSLTCGVVAMTVSNVGGTLARKAVSNKPFDDRALRVVCGAVAGMGLGFNGAFWRTAVVADPWPFSLLLFSIALCLVSRWHFQPYVWWLYLGAFLFYGLTLANSQELVPAVPGLVLFLIPTTKLDLKRLLPRVVAAVGATTLGLSAYLFLPIFSATNPPVNWGYPRTADGFLHTVTRGQYERLQLSPDFATWTRQIADYATLTRKDVGPIYLIAAMIPFLFLCKLSKPQRLWLLLLAGIFASLSLLMVAFLNPAADRQSLDSIRVYYAASHLVIAIFSGCGLTLLARQICWPTNEKPS